MMLVAKSKLRDCPDVWSDEDIKRNVQQRISEGETDATIQRWLTYSFRKFSHQEAQDLIEGVKSEVTE